jgi:hypothetical protein
LFGVPLESVERIGRLKRDYIYRPHLLPSRLIVTYFILSKYTISQLIIITMLGVYQIDLYTRRSCDQLPFISVRGVVCTIASTYASCSAVTNRFRTLLAKANELECFQIGMVSLYILLPLHPCCTTSIEWVKASMISLTTVLDRHKSPLPHLAYAPGLYSAGRVAFI